MGQDSNQQMSAMNKLAVGEIIEALKNNPSISRRVKSIIVFVIGFQVVIFLGIVFMFMKFSGIISDRDEDILKNINYAYKDKMVAAEKKLEDEKKRRKNTLKRKIEQSQTRIDDLKKGLIDAEGSNQKNENPGVKSVD